MEGGKVSEDRIYEALMRVENALGAVQAEIRVTGKNTDSRFCDVCARLKALEDKPSQTMQAGKTAVISTIVSLVAGAIAGIFTKNT